MNKQFLVISLIVLALVLIPLGLFIMHGGSVDALIACTANCTDGTYYWAG